jgi:hypothetical protein
LAQKTRPEGPTTDLLTVAAQKIVLKEHNLQMSNAERAEAFGGEARVRDIAGGGDASEQVQDGSNV